MHGLISPVKLPVSFLKYFKCISKQMGISILKAKKKDAGKASFF